MKTFNIYSTLFVILAFFASAITVSAEVLTSTGDGNWNAATTWVNESGTNKVPGDNDDVIILAGHTITLDADKKCHDVNNYGILLVSKGKNLSEVRGNFTNHEGAAIDFTGSNEKYIKLTTAAGTFVNNGTIINPQANRNYITVNNIARIDLEQVSDFRDNGGLIYVTTIDYSHYTGKTFHFGAGNEFSAEYDSKNWSAAYVWPENYIDRNVLYDFYPGKNVLYSNEVIIPSGKTCTYNTEAFNLKSLTIEETALLYSSDNRNLSISGQFKNSGTLKLVNGKTLNLAGLSNASFINDGDIINSKDNDSSAKMSIADNVVFVDHGNPMSAGDYNYDRYNAKNQLSRAIVSYLSSDNSTFYWYGTSGNWNTTGNWYTDEAHTNKADRFPNTPADHVVILAGQTCTYGVDLKIASLEIRGTLKRADKTPYVYGDLLVAEGGVLADGGTVNVYGKTTFSGSLTGSKTINAYDDVVVSSTGVISAKPTFNCYAGFTAQAGSKLNFTSGGATFKMQGDITFEHGSAMNIKGDDVRFQMADNHNVNFNGSVTFDEAKSIKIGSYAKVEGNGNNIKVNFGSDYEFISVKGSSNLFVHPGMVDLSVPDNLKYFTYTKGGHRFKLNLYSRPSDELTFYMNYANDSPNSAGWYTANLWSLVDGHCVYINYPVKYKDSKNEDVQMYYPGLKNDAFDSYVDHVVVGEGKALTLDRNIRCLASLVIKGTSTLTKKTGLTDPLCGNQFTIGSINDLKLDVSDDVVVLVNGTPSSATTFYSAKDGAWADDAMWSLKEGKKWFYVDDEGHYYYPQTKNDDVVIEADHEVSLNDTYTIGNLTVNGGLDLGRDNQDMSLSVGYLFGDGNITMKKTSNLVIRGGEDNWTGDMVIESEETGSMFYACKSGKWDDPTTWTTDPSLRPVKLNTYPGKDSDADVVTIGAGKSVTTKVAKCKIASLCLKGELKVENVDSEIIITGEVSGEGTLDVYNINNNFQVYRKKLNTFFPKGTVIIRKSCELPASEFGNLRVYAKDVRICGNIRINNNLTVHKDGELIFGRDLYSVTIDGVEYGNWTSDTKTPDGSDELASFSNKLIAMGLAGRSMPEEMKILFDAFVGGNIVLETGATLKASHMDWVIKRALGNVGGSTMESWSWLEVQGDVIVNDGAEIDFYHPYDPSKRDKLLKHGMVDRMVNVVFSGSKDSKFEVYGNGIVHVACLFCRKDENVELYLNPEKNENLYCLARCSRPDEDYYEYPYVINSGIFHLGPAMNITAWGGSRVKNGEPALNNRRNDFFRPESDILVDKINFGSNNNFSKAFSDLKNKIVKVANTYPGIYTISRRQKTYLDDLDEMFFFDQTRSSGLFIPEKAELWIDGATVNVGISNSDGTGLVKNGQMDEANTDAYYYGNVCLRGKLRVSNGGKLVLPNYSVGIYYESPVTNRCSSAAEIILEGENSEIHTSRIYGLHDRQINFKMSGGTLYFDKKTNVSDGTSFKDANNYPKSNTDATLASFGVANADGRYREEGCIFYMGNGGTFNMSGGRIFFQNVEESTTPDAINTLNLRNCSGLVSGGTIIFDQGELTDMNYLPFTNYVPENIKLNNLTVINSRKVEFWGSPTLTSDKGFTGHSLYVNGALCLGYNPVWIPAAEGSDDDDSETVSGHYDYTSYTNSDSWLATPENLYVGGDLYFGSTSGNHKLNTGGKYPMTFGVNFQFTDENTRTFPNLVFTGLNDQKMTTIEASPFWNNLTVSKSDSKAKVTLMGKDLYVFGDFEAIRGKIMPGEGQTDAKVTMRNGLKIQNVVQGGADGDMSKVVLHFKNYHDGYEYNGTEKVNFKTDVVLGKLSVDADNSSQRQFFLGDHNLKCMDGLTFVPKTGGFLGIGNITEIDKAFENYPFVCTSSIAQGGLTLPLSGTDERQFFMATLKNSNLLKTTVTVTPTTSVNGFLTVIPCNEYHPSLDDMSASDKSKYATEYYWRMKWDGTSTDPAFKYKFYCPLNVGRYSYTTGKVIKTTHYNYNYYEYCTPSGEVTPCWVAVHEINTTDEPKADSYQFNPVNRNSGDFTLGYNYDTAPGTIYYSVSSGNWEDGANWSTSPTGSPIANRVPGLKDIAVVQASHVVTVNDPNKKVGFITLNGSLVVKSTATGMLMQQFTAADDATTYTSEGEHTLIYEANGASASIINGDHTNLCNNADATIAYVNVGSSDYSVPSVNTIKSYPSLQMVGKVNISDATVADNQFMTVVGDLYVGAKEGSVVATIYGAKATTVNISPASNAYLEVKGQTVTAAVGTLNVNSGSLNTYNTFINQGTVNIGTNAIVNVYGDVDQRNTTAKKFNVYGKLCFIDNVDQLVDGYEVRFYDGSTLVVNKTEENNKVYFNAYIVTNNSSSKLNTEFNKGYLSLQPVNGNNSIYFGDEGGEFMTIPETFTLVASNNSGKGCTLTFQTYLHLDGKLYINDGASVYAYYGIGYSSTGESVLEVNSNAKLYASQIAPWSTSGYINFKQETGSVVELGKTRSKVNAAYGSFDIRDGVVKMNNKATLKIYSNSMDVSKPAIYYTPSSSDLNQTSSIAIYTNTGDGETFDIYALQPLAGFVIGSKSAYDLTVRAISPLTFNGTLSEGQTCTFDANGKDIVINGDATFSGQYLSNGNSIYLSSANSQKITFSNPTTIARLYKNGEGTSTFVNSNAETCVTDAFEVNNGTLSISSKTLRIHCEEPNIVNGTAITGSGISLCCPNKAQKIKAEGDISILDINNPKGVTLSDQPNPISITTSLNFTQGIFSLGSTGSIKLGEKATIKSVALSDGSLIPFGLDKMIDINLSSGDGSVTKMLSAKGSVMFPIGSKLYNKYSPITVNLAAFAKDDADKDAYYKVVPVFDIYPGMNSDAYKDHVMNFYWDVTTSNVDPTVTKATITCVGDLADAKGYEHNHSVAECGEYIAAWLTTGSLQWSKKQSEYGKAAIQVADNRMTLTYTLTTKANDFGGVYLGGCANVLPDMGDTYINTADNDILNNWDEAIWQKYDANNNVVIDPNLVHLPENTAVFIRNNTTVNMEDDYQNTLMVTILEGATLNVAKSENHNFGKIAGTGTIRVESGNLPGADWPTSAFNKAGGGTVYYAGTDQKEYTIMSEGLSWNNVMFGGKNIWRLREDNVSLQINGDFVVNGEGGKFAVQLADDRVVRLHGDLLLEAGEIKGNGVLQFNRKFTDVEKESGDSVQHIIYHNNVKVSGVEVNNNGGVVLEYSAADGVAATNNYLNVTKKLVLTNGVIFVPDEAALRVENYDADCVTRSQTAPSSTAYVDGWLYRYITSNNDKKYIFPVGNAGRYGLAYLEGYNTSGKVQNGVSAVRFVNQLPYDYDGSESTKALANATIFNTLGSEFWLVNKVNGANNYVYLSWDDQSSYNGTMSDVNAYYYNSYTIGKAGNWGKALVDSYNGDKSSGYIKVATTKGVSWGGKYAFALAGSALTSFSWTGKINNQWEVEGNWAGGVAPNSTAAVVIGDKSGIKNYPVISNPDPTSGNGNAMVKTITIASKDPDALLTIDGGALYVSDKIIVKDNNPGHVVLNQHYDNTSNLRAINGIKYEDENKVQVDYAGVVVNRTFETWRTFYVGSATLEGTFESYDAENNIGFNNLNNGGDLLKQYNPLNEKYTKYTSFGGAADYTEALSKLAEATTDRTLFGGGTIGLRDVKGETERTVVQQGTLWPSNKAIKWSALSMIEGANYGWNMFSNPYSFSIVLNTSTFTIGTNVNSVLWFRNYSSEEGRYYNTVYNMKANVKINDVITSEKYEGEPLDNGVTIAPNQGFFVRSSSASSASVQINLKSTPTNQVSGTSLKSLNFRNDVLRLVVSSDEANHDETALVFLEDGSRSVESFDADKIVESNTNNQIYVLKQNSRLSIPIFPQVDVMVDEIIPLGVQLSSKSSTASIKATNIAYFDQSVDVFLYDSELESMVNLRNASTYSFTAVSGQKIEDRFAIVLKALSVDNVPGPSDEDAIVTDVENVMASGMVNIFKHDIDKAMVVVSDDVVAQNAVVNVYDVLGRVVNSVDIKDNRTVVNLGEQKGIYIVEVSSKSISHKVKVLK